MIIVNCKVQNTKLMKPQKVQPHVIARSVATKQSHEIKHLQNTRLLRSARNDNFLDFLRNHQIRNSKLKVDYV